MALDFLNPQSLMVKVGIAAVIGIVGFGAGWKVQGWRYEVHAKKDIQATLDAERDEVKRLNKLAYSIGQELGKTTMERDDAARKHRIEIAKWQKEGTVYVQCPNGQPPISVEESAVQFGDDYVRLWNGSVCLALPAAEREACIAGGTEGAGAGSAPLTPAAVIDNLTENARRWGQCLDRLRRVENWAAGARLTP